MKSYTATNDGVKNLKKQHLINKDYAGHKEKEQLEKKVWTCPDCKQDFDRLDRYENHEHILARNAPVTYTDFTLISLESHLGKVLMAQPLLECTSVCLDMFYALPSRFPFLEIPLQLRQSALSNALWKDSANVNGVRDLEQVLITMVKNGQGNSLKLFKYVRIKTRGGMPVVYLRDNVTVMKSNKFKVTHISDTMFEISLTHTPVDETIEPPWESLPLAILQHYRKGSNGRDHFMHW